jgi:hypothetical protein
MHKRDKVVILFVIAWTGTILLLLAGIIRLPKFFSERETLLNLQNRLADRKAIEARMKGFLTSFQNESETLKTEIFRRENVVSNNTFSPLTEDKIPQFVNELQHLFAEGGAAIINLGYEKRVVQGDFIILPFLAEFRASYQGMRKVLHALESNPAGIRIDEIEFVSLDDEEHMVRIKMACTTRFKIIGQ